MYCNPELLCFVAQNTPQVNWMVIAPTGSFCPAIRAKGKRCFSKSRFMLYIIYCAKHAVQNFTIGLALLSREQDVCSVSRVVWIT